jgi:aspartate-semialdehyde dehydrogenase
VLALALAPLRPFGLHDVIVSTLQAISGGGYPGVPSLDILGNVVPVVHGEEIKMETETKKIFGLSREDGIQPHEVVVSASTTRVPVLNGHTELVSVSVEQDPRPEDLVAAFQEFSAGPEVAELPSSPPRPVLYLEEEDRPQPRLDADRGGAMGHNTVRGAAGAALLNAELLKLDGVVR